MAEDGAPSPDPTVRAFVWRVFGRFAFRCTWHSAYAWRRTILRLCGARVTPLSKIRRSVLIDRPWNVSVGARTAVGDDAVLRAAAPITIGDRCTVSQYAILTTVLRDVTSSSFEPRYGAVTLSDDSWVATDALVLPGTTLEEGAVVGARSTVEGDVPAWKIAVGDPARPRGQRVIARQDA